jgi:hypothetical protein
MTLERLFTRGCYTGARPPDFLIQSDPYVTLKMLKKSGHKPSG